MDNAGHIPEESQQSQSRATRCNHLYTFVELSQGSVRVAPVSGVP